MKTKTIPVLLTLATAAMAPAAQACQMYSVHTALDAKESRDGFYVSYFPLETDFGTLQNDGEEVHNDSGESLRSSVHQLVVGYQIDRRLGVQVNVPFLDRRFDRVTDSGHLESGSESGVGDVAVLALWRVAERQDGDTTWSWGLLGGIELPTGDSDPLAPEQHDDGGGEPGDQGPPPHESGIHANDLFQGSGSTDYLLGTTFQVGKGRFLADASLKYGVRTKGDFDYQFANETNVELGVGGYAWLSDGRTLALKVKVSGERKGEDERGGHALHDTARRTIYLGPAVSYSHRDRFLGELFIDFPIDQSNSGLQLVPDHRLRLAVTGRV